MTRRIDTRKRGTLFDPKKLHEPKLKYLADKARKRKGKDLSDEERTNITHEAIVLLKSNEEISEKYQVKSSVISSLV